MNKKTAALLIGAATGAGLVWAIRQGVIELAEKERDIVIDDDLGRPRVRVKPAEALLVSKQKITWHVTNDSATAITVSLENWRDDRGATPPPFEGQDLAVTVDAHKKGTIKAKAKVAEHFLETFYYDVYLNGTLGADPIVKLLL
jgi:hypothetical protein